MSPICVKCQRFFRAKKNGFPFIEAMPKGNDGTLPDARPGTADAQRWEPYKLWLGDLWRCDGCGAEIVSGAGRNPIAEHYEPDFKSLVDRYRPTLTVNDCCG